MASSHKEWAQKEKLLAMRKEFKFIFVFMKAKANTSPPQMFAGPEVIITIDRSMTANLAYPPPEDDMPIG